MVTEALLCVRHGAPVFERTQSLNILLWLLCQSFVSVLCVYGCVVWHQYFEVNTTTFIIMRQHRFSFYTHIVFCSDLDIRLFLFLFFLFFFFLCLSLLTRCAFGALRMAFVVFQKGKQIPSTNNDKNLKDQSHSSGTFCARIFTSLLIIPHRSSWS